jgi:hypothetical protein
LLSRAEPLIYHGLIAVSALRNVIGNREIMAEQLDHLLAIADLPHVTIQVLPEEFGAHGAMSGPIQLLRFADDEDAAYVESVLGMESVQEVGAVAALSAVWDDVASAAPSPKRSAEMIRAERKRAR